MNVLGLSGSLRAVSIHTALLHAAARAAPAGVEMIVFSGLGSLPNFNPDLENQEFDSVTALRSALNACDAVLIACPEYAHGLPGAFKNALDWVVGSGELSGKPVLALKTTARSVHAPAQLAEILRAMDARVLDAVLIELPRPLGGALEEPEVAGALRELWDEVLRGMGKAAPR